MNHPVIDISRAKKRLFAYFSKQLDINTFPFININEIHELGNKVALKQDEFLINKYTLLNENTCIITSHKIIIYNDFRVQIIDLICTLNIYVNKNYKSKSEPKNIYIKSNNFESILEFNDLFSLVQFRNDLFKILKCLNFNNVEDKFSNPYHTEIIRKF